MESHLDQLLTDGRSQPLTVSIDPIAAALAGHTVIVPTQGPAPAPPAPVPLRVGADANGRLWVYAYTSADRFEEAFPRGSDYSAIPFAALFRIVDGDPNLAGILLNSGSTAAYPIMRVLFDSVRDALQRTGNE